MYITDLDNTLLVSDGQLSDYTKKMLKEVIPHIDITFATARSLFTAGVVLDYIDFELPVICLNGAGIADPKTKQYIKTFPIEYDVFLKVIELTEDTVDPFVVGVHKGNEVLLHKEPVLDIHHDHLESRLRYNDTRQQLVEEFYKIDDFLNLTFVETRDKIELIMDRLEDIDGITLYFHPNTKKGTDYCTLDIMSGLATKGNAVKELCNMLHKDITDTISFGDDINDLSMFEVTGKAFKSSVSNLKEDYPKLCGEDAVIKFIIQDSVKIKEVFKMYNIDELVDESHGEFQFVRRLRDEYTSGMNPFNLQGECLFMAFIGDRVVGTCGLNIDPYFKQEDIGRVRHMYVLKAFRRLNIASKLLLKVIERGERDFNFVTLRTFSEEASKLYMKHGFIKTNKVDYATHIKE